MKNKLVCAFFLSLFSQALWLSEILILKSWEGVGWLNGELFSPILIAFIVSYLFLNNFYENNRGRYFYMKLFSLSIVNYFIYYLIKSFGLSIFRPALSFGMFISYSQLKNIAMISFLVLTFFTGLIYSFFVPLIGRNLRIIVLIHIISSFLLTILLSMVSITVLPGFGKDSEWIDSIKMGYPIFWGAFLLAMCSNLIKTKFQIPPL